MLNAHAIYRLLIEEEQPVIPDDPNQLRLPIDPDVDALDTKSEIMRYADEPFRIPGNGPTSLYQDLLDKLRGRARRKIGNNTYLVNHGESIAVLFHATDVVTAFKDGKIVVDSGGWQPQGDKINYGWRSPPGTTTRDRINSNLDSGWKIYQLKHVWYWFNVGNGAGTVDSGDAVRYPYTDGDTIHPDGSLKIQAHPLYTKGRKKRVA